MFIFAVTSVWALIVVVFLYAIIKPYFFRENLTLHPDASTKDLPDISIIIPARNEEKNIGNCLESITSQTYTQGKMQVIVVNDNSTDRTEEIVDSYTKKFPDMVTKVNSEPFKDGWTGKNHACHQGSLKAKGKYVTFMDSDTFAKRDLLTAATHLCEHEEIDLLSLAPLESMEGFSERVFLPPVFLTIASHMNFKAINDKDSDKTLANGQFLMFRKSTYDSIGGYESIKDILMDDLEFARKTKSHGYKTHWVFGFDFVTTRMYHSFSEIWEGFSKNLLEIVNTNTKFKLIRSALKSLIIGWGVIILPIITTQNVLNGEPTNLDYASCAISCYLAFNLIITLIMTLKTLKVPLIYFLGMPFGHTLYSLLLLSSYIKKSKGARKWKGRTYS